MYCSAVRPNKTRVGGLRLSGIPDQFFGSSLKIFRHFFGFHTSLILAQWPDNTIQTAESDPICSRMSLVPLRFYSCNTGSVRNGLRVQCFEVIIEALFLYSHYSSTQRRQSHTLSTQATRLTAPSGLRCGAAFEQQEPVACKYNFPLFLSLSLCVKTAHMHAEEST